MTENKESFKATLDNVSPLLFVQDDRADTKTGFEKMNGIVFGDIVLTVAHMKSADHVFTVVDPLTGRGAHAKYEKAFPEMDVALLDLKCTTPYHSLGGDKVVIGEEVTVHWYDVSAEDKTKLLECLAKGRIGGYYRMDGHDRLTVVLDLYTNKVMCGAAVTDKKGQLIGIVNTEMAYSAPGDKSAMVNVLLMTFIYDVVKAVQVKPKGRSPEFHAPPPMPSAPITPQLVVITEVGKNPDGSPVRESANACIVEGKAITVGHLLAPGQSMDYKHRVIDPGTLKSTYASYKDVYPQLDAAVLDLEAKGKGYEVARPVMDEDVNITSIYWDRVARKPATSLVTGKVTRTVNMQLYHDDGSPLMVDGKNEHLRYEILLPSSQAVACGSSVLNSDGLLIGIINGSAAGKASEATCTLYMSSITDILEGDDKGPQVTNDADKATGTLASISLINSDWDTMGDISSVTVYVYPVHDYYNNAPNPGFEDPIPHTNTDETNVGGYVYKSSQATFYVEGSTSSPRTGTYCLKMYNDAQAISDYVALQLWNWQHCEAGQTWKATAWVKGTVGKRVGIRLQYYHPGVSPTLEEALFALTADYQEITVSKVLSANMCYVTFDFYNYDTDSEITSYWDDVWFGRVPASGDISVEVSRTDGDAWTTAPITYDTSDERWEGHI